MATPAVANDLREVCAPNDPALGPTGSIPLAHLSDRRKRKRSVDV
jgi:hypothetical protein